eukprot:COSAG01_NODE_4189_length_5250_cov_12.234735_1_plen_94_part_00
MSVVSAGACTGPAERLTQAVLAAWRRGGGVGGAIVVLRDDPVVRLLMGAWLLLALLGAKVQKTSKREKKIGVEEHEMQLISINGKKYVEMPEK